MNQQAVIQTAAGQAAGAVGGKPGERPAALTFQPNVDIRDVGGDVIFTADIPGARADGIDVTFEDGVLTVHAAVPHKQRRGLSPYRSKL